MAIVNKLFIGKYLKKMDLNKKSETDFFAVGFERKCDNCVMVAFFTVPDFMTFAADHSNFQELSPHNKAYRIDVLKQQIKKVNNKKALRLSLPTIALYTKALNDAENYEKNILTFSAEQWENALEIVKKVKNQKNKGYALEYLLYNYFGLAWNDKKRGIDLELTDGEKIEIKFSNGQITL